MTKPIPLSNPRAVSNPIRPKTNMRMPQCSFSALFSMELFAIKQSIRACVVTLKRTHGSVANWTTTHGWDLLWWVEGTTQTWNLHCCHQFSAWFSPKVEHRVSLNFQLLFATARIYVISSTVILNLKYFIFASVFWLLLWVSPSFCCFPLFVFCPWATSFLLSNSSSRVTFSCSHSSSAFALYSTGPWLSHWTSSPQLISCSSVF